MRMKESEQVGHAVLEAWFLLASWDPRLTGRCSFERMLCRGTEIAFGEQRECYLAYAHYYGTEVLREFCICGVVFVYTMELNYRVKP